MEDIFLRLVVCIVVVAFLALLGWLGSMVNKRHDRNQFDGSQNRDKNADDR